MEVIQQNHAGDIQYSPKHNFGKKRFEARKCHATNIKIKKEGKFSKRIEERRGVIYKASGVS